MNIVAAEKTYKRRYLALVLSAIAIVLAIACGWLIMLRMQDTSSPLIQNIEHSTQIETVSQALVPSTGLRRRAVLLSPAVSVFVDRSATRLQRVQPVQAGLLASLPRDEDRAALVLVLRDLTEDDTIRNHAANILRAVGYERLTVEIQGVIANQDESADFRGWATQHLGIAWMEENRARTIQASALRDALTALAADRDIPVRREAIFALCRGGEKIGISAVHSIFDTPNQQPLLDLAVRLAGELNLRDCLPAIRRAAFSDDEGIRLSAIRVLAQWQDQESRTVIAAAQHAKSKRLQRAADEALSALNGASSQSAWKDTP